MKRSPMVVLLAVAGVGLANVASAEAPAKKKAATAPKAVMDAAADIKWTDVPGFPVKTAVLSGDPAKGEHFALHRFPAGFEAPMHHHTSDHHVLVVAGTVTLGPEGETAKSLGPGSHFAFMGMKKHTTKCEAGADCVLAVDCQGPWDIVMPDAKPAK